MFQVSRNARRSTLDIWPGFVDALSALLMVVIFVLMVFMVAQFYLSNLLSGREEQLGRLNRQIAELSDLLALERDANADLRARFAQLSVDLQEAVAARDALSQRAATLEAERRSLADQLAQALARNEALTQDLADRDAALAEAYESVDADRDTVELRLREIASLQADIRALRAAREALEVEMATLSLALRDAEEQTERLTAAREAAEAGVEDLQVQLRLSEEDRERLLAELASLRDRSQVLETDLADERERTVLAQRRIDEQDIRIEELVTALSETEAALDEEVRLGRESQALAAQLSRQIDELRAQLGRVQAVLEESERTVSAQDLEIANLSARLNQALVRRVEELSRYRSEFFGRLREVLGDNENIRVVGDRFVFQSEVLFDSGSARLGPDGRQQIRQLADTLQGIIDEIPDNIDWILRVDGHTDDRPIQTGRFPSNWELSTARATEVVKFLIDQGIPPDRLAATGFGEYQPIADGNGDEALRKNRRIEFKLTTK